MNADMENILYNTEKKEVAVILGYGIGNHLSVKFLQEIVQDLVRLFPLIKKPDELLFHEIAQSSRSHRYCWYTRFLYDLSHNPVDERGYITIAATDQKAYSITSHKKGVDGRHWEDETAESVMNRMIHG